MTAVDGRSGRPDILSASLLAEMTGNGAPLCGGSCSYAGGWLVRPTQGDATWSQGGSLPGTTSILVRSYHGFAWAAVFNARASSGNLDADLDNRLWGALAQATSYPEHDLFPAFP